MSFSKKNVIRGLHIQTTNSQGKFLSVLKGKIFDVVVDLRKKSRTYGLFETNLLSDKNKNKLFGVVSKCFFPLLSLVLSSSNLS